MTKKIITLLLIVTIIMLTVTTAFAAGDKQRGDNGTGYVNQYQVMNPPPFQTQTTGLLFQKTIWGGNTAIIYWK